MFTRIRNQLTLLNTTLTALSLLGFVLLFYFGLWSLLLREQEQDTLELAKRQSFAYHELREKVDREHSAERQKRPPAITVGGNDFYYFLSLGGNLLGGNEPLPALRSDILSRANTWRDGKPEVIKFNLPDGTEFPFMLAVLPLYEDNKLSGQLVVAKDLSAYYHFQSRLLQALAGASLVFLLVAALAGHFAAGRALIPIRKSFATQRQFVADASHELRTPLSVIQASLDVLDKEDGSRLSNLSQQIIADAKDEVRRMTRLVSDLLTLARADSGVVEVLKTNFDLRPIAEHVIRSLQHIATPKNITLSLAAPDEVPLRADRDRLSQLLFLLVDNGVKYTPPGGNVSLAITAAKHKKAPGITIIVQDTGIGIDAAERARIFERFYRSDKSRSREADGFGLGLSIANWIVAAHGGSIEVSSHTNAGSTFTIFLPS